MDNGDKNKKADEAEESEGEATEGGFGTGLRAQLQKRRGVEAEEQAATAAAAAGRSTARQG